MAQSLREAISKRRTKINNTGVPAVPEIIVEAVSNIVKEKLQGIEEKLRPQFEEMIDKLIQSYIKKNGISSPKGDKGDAGDDGVVDIDQVTREVHKILPSFQTEIIQRVIQKMPRQQPVDTQAIARIVLEMVSIPDLEKFEEKIKEEILAEDERRDQLKQQQLTIQDIKGLDSYLRTLGRSIREAGTGKMIHGGGDIVTAGSGVTISRLPNGQKEISASATGGSSVLMFAIPTGTIGSGNTIFTVSGQVVVAGADDGSDDSFTSSYNGTTGISTITYSIPPQNNVFAFVISGTNPTLKTGTDITGLINNSNTTFTVLGRVTTVFIDRIVDVGSVFSYNPSTNITTITTSVPPQNSISALMVPGFPITTQTPTCTQNDTGNPDGTHTQFSAVGQINAAIGDSGIDINATLAYNYSTNVTIITYSVPPQNNVSTF